MDGLVYHNSLILPILCNNSNIYLYDPVLQTIPNAFSIHCCFLKIAQYYRLPTIEGVLIAHVEPHSPADDAGLRKGDIIEAVDGKRIDDTTEISLNVRKKNITDKLTMSVNRYGRRFEVPIQLQARP